VWFPSGAAYNAAEYHVNRSGEERRSKEYEEILYDEWHEFSSAVVCYAPSDVTDDFDWDIVSGEFKEKDEVHTKAANCENYAEP
jgi:hypothetical protein